ncbi:MAG: Crp/Fnr family transcriptional regulator [Tissierellia bacterium]|nr:Crp/Fnr family transcriptional regulator [Tissierellia bacterium]
MGREVDMHSCCSKGSSFYVCASRVELFEDLSHDEQTLISSKAIHRDHKKMERIFAPEDSADRIIILRYGRVKLTNVDMNGKEYIYDIVEEGEILGEQTLFIGGSFGMEGICLTDAGTCTITRGMVEELVTEVPSVAVKFIGTLGKKLAEARELSRILSINDAKTRLTEYLHQQRKTHAKDDLELSRETIASLTNLTRETVSRKLKELEEEGIVELIGYKRIRILPGNEGYL